MKRAIIALGCVLILFSLVSASEATPTDKKLVALTFDDGPHATHTREILDILDKYQIKATFFVVGTNAEKFPKLVKETAERGHEIGNHTYSHPNMKSISYDELKSEILKNEELLFDLTGDRTTLFRPPCGAISESVSSVAENDGYRLILWDIDTRDWEHKGKSHIVQTVTKNIKPGAIILMHDFIGGETHTPEALEDIISALISDGYEFVTVSELDKK